MTAHNEPTEEELILAFALKQEGIKIDLHRKFWYFSKGEKRYIKPDISIPELKLCIEVDGKHHTGHAKQSTSDRLRARTIHRAGWEVQHVSNYAVNDEEQLWKLVENIRNEWDIRVGKTNPRKPTRTTLVQSMEPNTPTKKSPVQKKKPPAPEKKQEADEEIAIGPYLHSIDDWLIPGMVIWLGIIVAFRSVLIGIGIILLGIAWQLHRKNKKEVIT